MYSTPASELEVVALLKQRANVEVANLSWVTSLPTPDYRRALAVLDAAIDHDIPEPVRFIAKLCFSDRRATPYYRRIFQWWATAQGDTEPFSLEWALRRTYTPAQSQWTWQQMQAIPTAQWPLSLLPRLWNGNVPRDQLRTQLLALLESGECQTYILIAIARTHDPLLTAWFLAQPAIPRPVLRALPGAPAQQRNVRYLTPRETAAATEVFSAEIDEDGALIQISELADRVGWPSPVPAFDLDAVKPSRPLVIWQDRPTSPNRILAATRDDETTLIIRWLVTNGD